ncbi:MAG: hypothetical protein Q8904_09815 [Bacteroidota bacterium]|nr:hypothetical protein [Bacteroidota bacterium]
MTKIDKKTYLPIRFLLMLSICCIFFLLSSTPHCDAQGNNSPITLSFLKGNDSVKTSELYFNVLKIRNTSTKTVRGNVLFNSPENWKIISFTENETIIQPGDSVSIPVRVSPTADALGGITYILGATFKTRENQTTTNTYLTIPSKSKWEFIANKTNLYFTEDNTDAKFEVKLSNKGNTNELIKLHLKIGKLLMLPKETSDDIIEFVNLPAFKDTVITHVVVYKKKLSYADKTKYENNWKESSVQVTASSEQTARTASILFHQLSNTFYNQRAQNASPLNFDYQLYNLMSSQEPSSNFRVYGSVLFPKDRELEYMGGLQNIYFSGDNNFDIDRQLFYSLRYLDKRNNIELGYNVNGGSLHTINGRGISGRYRINAKSQLSYAATQNPYSHTLGEYVGYSTSIHKLSLSTELTHESSSIAKYDANSGLIGTGFTLFKHHSLSVQFMESQSRYNLLPAKDTTVLGYSYKIDYTIRYKKFDLRLSDLNSKHNYIRNSGLQQIYLDSKYTLSDRVILLLYANHQNYSTTLYPYNFYSPGSINTTDYGRLTTSISSGNITYQIGPNYSGTQRVLYNSVTGYKSDYQTYQPGIWGATSFKLSGYRSLTPNITISNLRFYYNTNDPLSKNYSSDKNIYYTVGLNYFDTNWRVNAYYSSGSVSDLYRSVQVDVNPTVSSSIQFRPSYENFFFDRKVKLSAYINYAYYMPSGRENVSYNVRYDQFLKHGWMFSVSGFMYSNVVPDQNQGTISTKDLNFVVGFTKSFNIQQPRLKYYNFKTVFFNDLDGNHIKSDNEPPVSNILVNVQKDRTVSTDRSTIPEIQLLSDVNGGVFIENLPKDNYKLAFTPLVNLQNLYFLNGEEQTYFNDKERTLYVPLAESYRVKGKIIVVRDPNSSEGKIDLSGIRVTASGMNGETYSTLTDNFGAYVLNVPNANRYKIHVNNVFGEHYNIDTNEMEVQFAQNKAINLDFTFIEKLRGVDFEGGTEIFKFNTITAQSEAPVTADNTLQTSNPPAVNPPSYAIQLGAVKSYRDPSYYKNKYRLSNEVVYMEKDGLFKYYTGNFSTLKAARAEIARLRFPGLLPVQVDRSLLKEATPVISTKPVVEKPVTYTIQLDALKTYRDPSFYKDKYKLKNDVLYLEKDGEFKYYTGDYTSLDAAKADIAKLGLAGFPVAVDRALLKKAIPVESFQPVTVQSGKGTTVQHAKPKTNVSQPVVKAIPVPTGKTQPEVAQPVSATTQSNASSSGYAIQLDALETFRDPSYYKIKYKLPDDVLWLEKEGKFYYYTGNYPTIKAADADIARYGLAGYIVSVDRSQLKKGNTYANNQIYTIQLDMSKNYQDLIVNKAKFKIKGDVLYFENEGKFIYVTGNYPTMEKAKADMLKQGIKGTIIAVDKSSLKSK